jgi:uncharacterized protein YybS (DUF2232 family)
MSEQTQKVTFVQQFVPALLGGSVTAILFALCFMIPPAGIVLCLLVPFPAIYSRFRTGRGTEALVVMCATFLTALLFNPQTAMFYLIQFGLISTLIPEMLARGLGATRTIAWTTAMTLLVCILVIAGFAYSEGQNVHQGIAELIRESFNKAVSYYEARGFKGDDLAAVKKTLTVASDLFSRTYPAFATVFIIAVAGFNVLLTGRYCRRFEGFVETGEFKDFKNPDFLVWFLIASGFSMLSDSQMLTTPALNMLVILALLYFIQGMAIVLTLIDRNSQARLLRTAFYLLLIFQPYVAAPVVALGIFDLWGDFRTPRKQENL